MERRIRTKPASRFLHMARKQAAALLGTQIERGRQLRQLRISSRSQLRCAQTQITQWRAYTKELIDKMLGDSAEAEEITGCPEIGRSHHTALEILADDLYHAVDHTLGQLESLLSRLELIPEAPMRHSVVPKRANVRKVFLVHGRDEGAKQAVARYLERLGLDAVILSERPSNGSKTIIEKFEKHSAVGFAVVLLTPDDVGALASDRDTLSPRARQNVVFELGYFVGKLGRQRVCALYSGRLELPTDIAGVIYIPMEDGSEDWKLRLFKELQSARMRVKLDKAM